MTALAIKPDGHYMDATYGRGGHSAAILARLDARGRLLSLDRDPTAIAAGRGRWEEAPGFTLEQASFRQLAQLADRHGLGGGTDGLLFDLGVSSPQLEAPERGFSFTLNGPLDMRMDPAQGTPAHRWLAGAPEQEIAAILRRYGEERYAGRIARAIVTERGARPIETTRQLAELVRRAKPHHERHKHPATRTFLALRIHINNELEELAAALDQSLAILAGGGRLVVISFHSLEDRIVKRFMRAGSAASKTPRKLPVTGGAKPAGFKPLGKAIRPSSQECAANPRARSAVMRVAERIQ